MRKRNLLLTAFILCGPLFCAASCDSKPVLSSVSISEGPVVYDPEAEEAKFEDFSLFYVPERKGYLVGDYKGSLSAIVVPEEATGDDGVTAPIVGLADRAFYSRKGITTVVLNSNITFIGDYAFAHTDITDLRIMGNLTYFGEHAFDDSKITFYEKDGIEYLPSLNEPYATAFCDHPYDMDEKLDPSCRHAVIKSGTTEIRDYFFSDCSLLQSIYIPASVAKIGKLVIWRCPALVSVAISPDNSIYDSRENCNGIVLTAKNCLIAGCSATTIPDSITSIEQEAFSECTSLKVIQIPASVTYIGHSAFYGCTSLSSAELPSSLTEICGSTFQGCSSLESITIPSTVKHIYPDAFAGCSSLKSLYIPASVKEIENGAFISCSSLTSISVDPNNTVFDSREGCNAIIATANKSLILGCCNTIIPSSVRNIGWCAFAGCSLLESITIPAFVMGIDYGAFSGCSSLKTVNIPYSTSLYVNSYLSVIGRAAFKGCSSLESIAIPASVEVIEGEAFDGCSSLTIFCRGTSQPSRWDSDWNPDNRPVFWGYRGNI